MFYLYHEGCGCVCGISIEIISCVSFEFNKKNRDLKSFDEIFLQGNLKKIYFLKSRCSCIDGASKWLYEGCI
jgi:hypothetical protein